MNAVDDTLRELGNIGSGNAAASLEDWLGEPITISMTDTLLLPADEVSRHLDGSSAHIIGIHARVTGGLEGHMLYLLSVEEAERVLAVLLGVEEGGEELADCRASALSETGNILFGSYVNALYEMLGTEIDITPPRCSNDPAAFFGAGDQSEQSSGRQHVMVVETLLINEAVLSRSRLLFFTWVERIPGMIRRAGL